MYEKYRSIFTPYTCADPPIFRPLRSLRVLISHMLRVLFIYFLFVNMYLWCINVCLFAADIYGMQMENEHHASYICANADNVRFWTWRRKLNVSGLVCGLAHRKMIWNARSLPRMYAHITLYCKFFLLFPLLNLCFYKSILIKLFGLFNHLPHAGQQPATQQHSSD